jgi:UDP-N-acetylmuramyl pentapeptide synthase
MPDQPIRPIHLPQSDPESLSHPFPANLPADKCLALLRAGRAVRYEVRELADAVMKFTLNGKTSQMPIPGRYAVMAHADGAATLAALNLTEEQARDRVKRLNAPGRPSGTYSLS